MDDPNAIIDLAGKAGWGGYVAVIVLGWTVYTGRLILPREKTLELRAVAAEAKAAALETQLVEAKRSSDALLAVAAERLKMSIDRESRFENLALESVETTKQATRTAAAALGCNGPRSPTPPSPAA